MKKLSLLRHACTENLPLLLQPPTCSSWGWFEFLNSKTESTVLLCASIFSWFYSCLKSWTNYLVATFEVWTPHEQNPGNSTEPAVVFIPVLNREKWFKNRILHWNENKYGFGAVFIRPLFGVWRCRSSEQQSRGGDWPISQNFALIPCKAHWVTALWLQWLQWLYPSRAKSRKQYRTRSCFHSRFKSWKLHFTLEWKQICDMWPGVIDSFQWPKTWLTLAKTKKK